MGSLKHRMLATILLCILVSWLEPTKSFSPRLPTARYASLRRNLLILNLGDSSDNNYTAQEIQNMRDLIFSLSLEPTDDDRRSRVKAVFDDALGGPNGMPKRFTDLFDSQLLKIGDEVQSEAKKKFFEANEDVEENISASTVDDDGEVVPPAKREKTEEELQLWALVDMMVQTKTIVKTNNGDLGSKGTFQ